MLWRVLLLVFGVFCGATAVILIKLCALNAMLLAAYRQLLAAGLLAPLLARELRRHAGGFGRRRLARTILPGAALGTHFISWIVGARMTPAANSSLIVNMVPIVMPFLLYALVRERLNRGEWLGTCVALAGVAMLAWSDYRFSRRNFLGDVICFGSMVLFAVYLTLGRRNRDFPSLWLYIVPLYFFGGVVSLAAAAAGGVRPWEIGTARDICVIVALAAVPTVMGHSIFNYSMRHLRGQAVGIANLGQFIFAAAMAYFLPALDRLLPGSGPHPVPAELPGATFYPAAVLVVAGSVLALRATPPRAPAGPRGAAPGAGGPSDRRPAGPRPT